MTRDAQGSDPLVELFAERKARPSATDADPPADDVWAVVNGQRSREETLALLDRTADDPRLALEWRLARELGEHIEESAGAGDRVADEGAAGVGDGTERAGQASPSSRTSTRWRSVLPWAASLLLTLGSLVYFMWPGDPPAFRNTETPPIESLLEPGVEIDRADAVLRWRGPEGARFEISVLRQDDLTEIFRVADLIESHIALPLAVTDALPPDTELLWRVEAVLENGERVRSATFRIRLREKE